MPKTIFSNGTIVSPAFLNAINNPVYSATPSQDGQIAPPVLANLPDVGVAINACQARIDKAATFYQYFISDLAPVAMTLMPQAILATATLPAGTYIVSGQALANLPSGGLSNMNFRAGLGLVSGDLPDSSWGNYLQWDGVMNIRMVALPVARRVITLPAPAKMYLNAQCTNFGSVIQGTWTGNLLAELLPTP